jgi:hypothetical protein
MVGVAMLPPSRVVTIEVAMDERLGGSGVLGYQDSGRRTASVAQVTCAVAVLRGEYGGLLRQLDVYVSATSRLGDDGSFYLHVTVPMALIVGTEDVYVSTGVGRRGGLRFSPTGGVCDAEAVPTEPVTGVFTPNPIW